MAHAAPSLLAVRAQARAFGRAARHADGVLRDVDEGRARERGAVAAELDAVARAGVQGSIFVCDAKICPNLIWKPPFFSKSSSSSAPVFSWRARSLSSRSLPVDALSVSCFLYAAAMDAVAVSVRVVRPRPPSQPRGSPPR